MSVFTRIQKNKKYISSFFVLFFIFNGIQVFATPIVPLETDPILPVPTADSAIRSKEVEMTISGRKIFFINYDVLAISSLRILVNALGTYTVNWINNDFKSREGGTGFPLDLESTFKKLGDGLAGQIIEQAVGAQNGKLCSPFRAQIKVALISNANLNSQKNADDFSGSCPLTSIIKNGEQGITDFINGDFISGGWDAWNTMTQDPEGNPYSSMFRVQGSINSRILSAVGLQKEQLSWGKGFLASQDCDAYVDKTSKEKVLLSPGATLPAGATCVQYGPVKTPGSIVEGQLQKVFGSEVDQLNVASNFNQVVTALVGQLQKKLLTPGGKKGLFDTGRYVAANPAGGNEFGICSADKDFAIANVDTVTWSYTGISDDSTTFKWSGDDAPKDNVLSTLGSKPQIKYKYTTEGVKLAQLIVTQTQPDGTTDADGNPNMVTKTSDPIDCTGAGKDLTISKFPALSLSCQAVDASTGDPLPINLKPDTVVKWIVKIIGGSGQLGKIDVDESTSLNVTKDNMTKPSEWNLLLPPAELAPFFTIMKSAGPVFWFVANPLPTSVTKNSSGKFEHRIEFGVNYKQEGTWGLSFDSIRDMDNNVPILTGASCSRTFTVDKTIQ